jgi:ABC-2 type transport system ATP-binding protein
MASAPATQVAARCSDTPTIEVANLCKNYGSLVAIDEVSFTVRRGEIVGFLGPNGAGKSTTMRIIVGLHPATSGVVRINGIPVAWHPEAARRYLGYMPENNPLPEDLRVVEYLHWRARLKGLRGREVSKRVAEAMESCDLVRKARRRLIGTLSKGFRQRVGIADALLGAPDAIILDEPTIGLDPHQILTIRRLIKNLRGKVAVLISSHILPEIEQVCDRVIIINGGRIVASGTAEALRREFIPDVIFELVADVGVPELTAALISAEPQVRVEDRGVVDAGTSYRRFAVKMPAYSPLAPNVLGQVWAVSQGRVRELHSASPSLEDIFIAATRRSWENKTKANQ